MLGQRLLAHVIQALIRLVCKVYGSTHWQPMCAVMLSSDSVVEESPIASNRPRRAAAQAPKKYTVTSSESSDGDSDASEATSEAESISEDE